MALRDGAYLLRSNQAGWSAQEFWETYIQLTVVERAFRILKSHLLLRPIWHHYSGRIRGLHRRPVHSELSDRKLERHRPNQSEFLAIRCDDF